MSDTPYAMTKSTSLSFADADRRVREELQKEGFGVLTEIDVAATMKKKLDLDLPPYEILGACAPQLAGEALQQEPDIGLLLPCNVVVRSDAKGVTTVEALDPVQQLALSPNRALSSLAEEARARLTRVLAAIS